MRSPEQSVVAGVTSPLRPARGRQERCFPGALYSSTHFCGLPFFITLMFRLVKPFMAREVHHSHLWPLSPMADTTLTYG